MLGVDERLIGSDVEMQIRLMPTAKYPQICAQRRARPFARVAMHLSLPITIVIARPLARTVADGPVPRMTAWIAVGLIGIEHRAADRNVLVDQLVAGPLIRMLTDPEAVFAALT